MAAPKPKEAPKPEETQQKSVLARAALVRNGHAFITEAGFAQRKAYLVGKVSAGGFTVWVGGRDGVVRGSDRSLKIVTSRVYWPESDHFKKLTNSAALIPTMSTCLLLFDQQDGVLEQKLEPKNLNDMMGNPDMMQGMLKQQMGGLVPQVCGMRGGCERTEPAGALSCAS